MLLNDVILGSFKNIECIKKILELDGTKPIVQPPFQK